MKKRTSSKVKYTRSKLKKKLKTKVHPKAKRKGLRRKFLRRTRDLILAFLIFNLIVISLAGFFAIDYLHQRQMQIPTPDKVFPEVGLATEIYDRNGERLYRLFDDESNNDKVVIDEVNNTIRASLMAAEDSEFYNHNGIDLTAITRCAVKISQSDGVCGGSTITQQLIKITTKQKERTLEAKIDEVLLAYQVEEKFEKDQILEMYLRVTPYGSNITGIKTAARFYFDTSNLSTLTLAQATILAAIINNPANLSPTLSLDNEKAQKELKKRQGYILDQLSKKLDKINSQLQKNKSGSEMITQEMIDKARTEEIVYKQSGMTDIKAGHFVNYALNKLQEGNYNNGKPFTLQQLKTGGYRIYTSLDYKAQQVAERYVEYAGNGYKWANMYNAAVMTTSPSTGEIITMAGSKSFSAPSELCDDKGQHCFFNPQVNIFTSKQSPGSTNKSIGYYIAFSRRMLYPWSYLTDVPTTFGEYQPKNWDGGYLGNSAVTARDMLRLSRNIPAVKVLTMIGLGSYLDTSRAFGYTTYEDYDQFGPSVILGGADIYLDEHTQAYGVFANGGDLVKLNPILKIEDKDGNIVYSSNPERKNVADPYGVSMLNQTLYRLDTVNAPIYWDWRDMAGKTGTTEENKDVLLVIYSPDFVTTAWGGNNNNEPLNSAWGWPGFLLIPWVRDYMYELGNVGWFNQRTPFSWVNY